MQNGIHHFEMSAFLEIVLGTKSHILYLSLLLTDCGKVVEYNFELSLFAEGIELLYCLSSKGFFLESDPPCSECATENINALLF